MTDLDGGGIGPLYLAMPDPPATFGSYPATVRLVSRLAWPVDVGAVLDGYYIDTAALVVGAVDHPVVAAAGAVQTLQPEFKWLADLLSHEICRFRTGAVSPPPPARRGSRVPSRCRGPGLCLTNLSACLV